MNNKLFLLEMPASNGTKIVLNKQSDKVLHDAEIINPIGIKEDDIAGLADSFAERDSSIRQLDKESQGRDDELTDNIATVAADLASEVSRSVSIDNSLSAALSAETAARQTADSVHDTQIAAIETEHAADTAAIYSAITTEQARAEAAESANAQAIATETAARIAAVSAEESARAAADTALQAALDAMDAAYKVADSALQSDIDSAQTQIDSILSGSTFSADTFAEIVNIINAIDQSNDTAFASYVVSNDAALAAETAARQAADDALTLDLAAEVARATAAEAQIAADLASEVSRSVAIDDSLSAALSAETANREAADVNFQNALDNAIADRVANDQVLTDNLNAEILRAETAEQTNAAAIAAEEAARLSKDALQDAALSAETLARTTADAGLQAQIDSLESSSSSSFSAETAARIAADAALQSELDSYKTSNNAALAAEVTARANGDAALQTALDAYKTSNDSALAQEILDRIAGDDAVVAALNAYKTSNDAALAAEVTRATTAEDAISSDLSSYQTSNDAALADEIARATAAEDAISSDLSSYQTSNDAALAAETARATAAEGVLQSNIDVEAGRIDAILSGASIDLNQFKEIVEFVESIDLENDQALLAAVNDLNIAIEVAKTEAQDADAVIVEKVGYDNRSQLSAELYNQYAAEITAELDANGTSDFAPLNEANFKTWLYDRNVSDIKGLQSDLNTAIEVAKTEAQDADAVIVEKVGYDNRGQLSDELYSRYAAEITAELDANGTSDFAPLNEANFKAWLYDRNVSDIKNLQSDLDTAIEVAKTEAQDADAVIVEKVGYDNRGQLSDELYSQYAAEINAELDANGTSDFAPLNEANFKAWLYDRNVSDIKGLQSDLEAEISRATSVEAGLETKVQNILSNTDLSKIDSFTELVDKINEVGARNFDSIYSKKTEVSYDPVLKVLDLLKPLKVDSMMVFINGLMVERDVDYTETIVNGQVTSATLLGDAADLADLGAKLMAYGVHGDFENIVAVDYANLIQNAQIRIAEIEGEITQATTDRQDSEAEYQDNVVNLQANLNALVTKLEDTIATLEEEENNVQILQVARQEALDAGNQAEADQLLVKITLKQNDINDLTALVENDNQEIKAIESILNQLEAVEKDAVSAYDALITSLETEKNELFTQIEEWENLLNG
jgi:hypothetical protein